VSTQDWNPIYIQKVTWFYIKIFRVNILPGHCPALLSWQTQVYFPSFGSPKHSVPSGHGFPSHALFTRGHFPSVKCNTLLLCSWW